MILVLNPAIPNGFDICRAIKSDPDKRKTMVLMITDLNDVSDIERAVEAETDDFLSKPVDKLEFLKRVRNGLELSQVIDKCDDLR